MSRSSVARRPKKVAIHDNSKTRVRNFQSGRSRVAAAGKSAVHPARNGREAKPNRFWNVPAVGIERELDRCRNALVEPAFTSIVYQFQTSFPGLIRVAAPCGVGKRRFPHPRRPGTELRGRPWTIRPNGSVELSALARASIWVAWRRFVKWIDSSRRAFATTFPAPRAPLAKTPRLTRQRICLIFAKPWSGEI